MKYFLQRHGDWRIVGIHLHDVGHHVPPFLRDGVYVVRILRVTLALTLLITKQDVRVLVPIDAVVADAAVLNHLHQLRPDGSMATLVLFLTTWLQVHLKCKTFHITLNIEL